MGVYLQPISVSCLQSAQFLRFIDAGIDREPFIEKQIPDLFADLARIECLVLRVANTAKFFGRLRWLGAIAATHQLHYALTSADLPSQNAAQIAFAGLEDVLPDRIIAEKGQSIGY